MRKRYELLKMSGYIGIFDSKKGRRLNFNLIPKKSVIVKAKASAYEGGYTTYYSTDLHRKLRNKRTINEEELKKLEKMYRG